MKQQYIWIDFASFYRHSMKRLKRKQEDSMVLTQLKHIGRFGPRVFGVAAWEPTNDSVIRFGQINGSISGAPNLSYYMMLINPISYISIYKLYIGHDGTSVKHSWYSMR